MIRSILLVFIMLFTVQALNTNSCCAADSPDYVTFGLYADDLHTTNCVYAEPLTSFPVYFYILITPIGSGVEALEMSVEQSSYNILIMAPDFADIVAATLGSVPGDIAISFSECCEVGWFHVFTVQVILMDQFPEYLEIGPWTGMTYPRVADCTPTHEQWDVLDYYSVYINEPGCSGPVSTGESTWGAIKNMYN